LYFHPDLGVAALLAAAMSLPARDVAAAEKYCPPVPGGPFPGKWYYPGAKFKIGMKTYICDDDGTWIIITDEKFDPGTQPPQPRFPRVSGVPGAGGVLAQP
ncbi:MAG TPA: hypothetical protein VFO85_11145, partial [Vicinamibacteria bacterium]|nr:hypothetical protein [Vicinamibacteria bacterium]